MFTFATLHIGKESNQNGKDCHEWITKLLLFKMGKKFLYLQWNLIDQAYKTISAINNETYIREAIYSVIRLNLQLGRNDKGFCLSSTLSHRIPRFLSNLISRVWLQRGTTSDAEQNGQKKEEKKNWHEMPRINNPESSCEMKFMSDSTYTTKELIFLLFFHLSRVNKIICRFNITVLF